MIAMLSFYCIGFQVQTLRHLTVEASERVEQSQQQQHSIEGIGYGHVYKSIKLDDQEHNKESAGLPVQAARPRRVGNSLLRRIHDESVRARTTTTTTTTTNGRTIAATRTRTVGTANNTNTKRRIAIAMAWPVLDASENIIPPRTKSIGASANTVNGNNDIDINPNTNANNKKYDDDDGR
jgi:hypothetical protein